MDSEEKTSNFEWAFTTHLKSKLEHLFALQVIIKEYLPLSTCGSGFGYILTKGGNPYRYHLCKPRALSPLCSLHSLAYSLFVN